MFGKLDKLSKLILLQQNEQLNKQNMFNKQNKYTIEV